VTPLLVTHDVHTWHLEAVHQDDGETVHEYVCEGCGAVDYR
jgi:hypothetical protein